MAHVGECKGENIAGTEGEVGEGESGEEECLKPPFFPMKVRRESIWMSYDQVHGKFSRRFARGLGKIGGAWVPL